MKLNLVALIILPIMVVSLFLGFLLSNIDSSNKLEAYSIAISFIGLFATFGGAYLGAKKSGDIALERDKLREKDRVENEKDRVKNIILMNKNYLDGIYTLFSNIWKFDGDDFLSKLKIQRHNLYDEYNNPKNLKDNTHIKFFNENIEFHEYKLIVKDNDFTIDNIDFIISILQDISFDMKDFSNIEKNTIYKLKQILPRFKKYFSLTRNKQFYQFNCSGRSYEIKTLFLLYCLLIIDVQEEILKLSIEN